MSAFSRPWSTLMWSSCTRACTYLYWRRSVLSGDMYCSTDNSMNGLGMESARTDLGGGTGAMMTGKRQARIWLSIWIRLILAWI